MEGVTEVCLSYHSHFTETYFLKAWVNGSLPMGGGGKPEYLKKNLENQPENQ